MIPSNVDSLTLPNIKTWLIVGKEINKEVNGTDKNNDKRLV